MIPYYIIMGIIAYLIGSINFSILISKKKAGFDIREKGSGNAGTTNVLRTVGKKASIITLICDILKGVVAILVAYVAGLIMKDGVDRALLIQLAGIAVILGHTFPIFFGFKGGKGIATALGVLLMTNWNIGLICLVFALLLMVLTKMVSVGSLAAAVLFPVLVAFMPSNAYIVEGNHLGYIVYAVILAVLVIFNHRANVKRLLTGTENKIDFKKLKK